MLHLYKKWRKKTYIFIYAATAPKPWEDTQETNKNDYLLRLERGKNKQGTCAQGGR